MKKILKNPIITFLLGIIISTSIGVSAYSLFANNIYFSPTDTSWKKPDGSDITDVETALNDLYEKALLDNANTLRLVNHTNNISAEVGKKYLIVISVTSYNNESQKYKPSIISGCTIEKTAGEVGHTFDVLATYSNAYIVKATSNTITIQGNVVDSNWTFVTYYKID